MAPELSPLQHAKVLLILHRAFVQARNLALAGERESLIELTDTFEVVPDLIARQGAGALEQVGAILAEYQARHPQGGYDYVSILGMDEGTFAAIYGLQATD